MIDEAVLSRNISRMADHAAAAGLNLRPHAKTHKMLEVADLQLSSGAVGLTVATIGEAEVFAQHGIEDIFIAYPLWIEGDQALRLRRLSETTRITVGVDSAEGAHQLGSALRAMGIQLAVLIEVDSGQHRSGVRPEDVVAVAEAADTQGLRVEGCFTFPGHSYAPGAIAEAAAQEEAAIGAASYALSTAGFDASWRSGGSTPTAGLTNRAILSELRPGVYVFGDAQQVELGRCAWDDIALTVTGTVVSRNDGRTRFPRRVILDCGSKILGADRASWASGHGRLLDHPDARISALSEHHATVDWPDEGLFPALGSRLRVIPNHVCTTVNLVDDAAIVRDGDVVDLWRVAARGKNS